MSDDNNHEGEELDRAAMKVAKLALGALAAFISGHARIVIDHHSTQTLITFETTAKGLNES